MKAHENKTALVTGASRGIGRAIALKLAQEGARVVVNYHQDEEAAKEVVARIKESGGEAVAIQADIADLDAVEKLFSQAEAKFGKLDILVNNAGYAEFVPLEEATPEHFDTLFDLNVRGLFFAMQHGLRMMNDGGRIINISSTGSHAEDGQAPVYSATKAAVNALTSTVSKEAGKRKITVNAVSPGLVETDLTHSMMSDEEMQKSGEEVPLGRAGQPDDIADIVSFLASNAARWITGREIIADGGAI